MTGTIVVAVISVLGAFVVARQNAKLVPHRRRRDTIEHDLRILKELPAESAMRSRLLVHIDSRVEELMSADRRRRDWSGVVGGGVFVLFLTSAALAWDGPSWGSWVPKVLAVLSFSLGCLVIFESWGNVERDEAGARLTGPVRPLRRRRAELDEGQSATTSQTDLA